MLMAVDGGTCCSYAPPATGKQSRERRAQVSVDMKGIQQIYQRLSRSYDPQVLMDGRLLSSVCVCVRQQLKRETEIKKREKKIEKREERRNKKKEETETVSTKITKQIKYESK